MAVPGRRDQVTAVGNLLGVQPGENLRLVGEWVTDKKYGEQFRVDSYVTLVPATLVGIQRYLGSGLVRGMGKVMAARLVEHFGLSTLEVIDNQPERLVEVEGIGPVRSDQIKKAWVEQREIKQVMIFLQTHGVSTQHAIKIYKRYKDRAVALVKENPYRLASDIFGIGFHTADQIAANLGISKSSPERAKAGLLFTLASLSSDGHTGQTREPLVNAASNLLEVATELIEDAVRSLAATGEVVIEAMDREGGEAVFAKPLYDLEVGVAKLLLESLSRAVPRIAIDIERALAWFEEKQALSLAPEQREAIRRAVTSKVLVITGGPGTGKTTLINGIIQILEKKGKRISLTAPTGRAAKRMTETTETACEDHASPAGIQPAPPRLRARRSEPARGGSRHSRRSLDGRYRAHVSPSLRAPCRLPARPGGRRRSAPSVGPGNVLVDVIRSTRSPVVRLEHIFRQAEKSLIVTNAHRVNHGELPVLTQEGAERRLLFPREEDPADILATIKTLIKERIPRKFGLDPVHDIQVLSPMHKGLLGAAQLNAELQRELNPSGPAVSSGNRTFRGGDKVMQLRNNYDLDVFNGDIGRIAAIDDEQRSGGRRLRWAGRDLRRSAISTSWCCAYACSIHKAQGSEYPA